MVSAHLSARDAIHGIAERLRRQPPCPDVRHWQATLSKYEHAIAMWAIARPNIEQVDAMNQCVADLGAEVFAFARGIAAPTREALADWASER